MWHEGQSIGHLRTPYAGHQPVLYRVLTGQRQEEWVAEVQCSCGQEHRATNESLLLGTYADLVEEAWSTSRCGCPAYLDPVFVGTLRGVDVYEVGAAKIAVLPGSSLDVVRDASLLHWNAHHLLWAQSSLLVSL